MSSHNVFKCESRHEKYEKMDSFFEDQKFCDVVLIAGRDNTRISAHRIVLSAASDYFYEFFDNPENTEKTFDGITGKVLTLFIKFIYSGNLEISSDTVEGLMSIAHITNLDEVVSQCIAYYNEALSVSNCLSIVTYSDDNCYHDLFEKSMMFAAQHFTKLFAEHSFLELKFQLLLNLIQRSDLKVRSEEDVYSGIMTWIAHDTANRDQYFLQLLSYLRFPLISPEFIIDELGERFLLTDIQKIILKAFKWHLLPSARSSSLFPPEYCEPRKQKGKIMLIKQGTNPEANLAADIFDPISNKLKSLECPPQPHQGWYTNGILSNEKVYLSGTTVQDINFIDCLDLETNEWTQLPPMTIKRYSFGLVELNGFLYAIGGNDGANDLNIVQKIDLASPEKWESVSSMNKARNHPGVVKLNGLLYAMGSNDDFEHNTFEFYDTQLETWVELKAPELARTSVSLTKLNGYLYAVGGRTQGGICTIVERYDPKTNSWTEISPSGKFKQYLQCSTFLDQLIVLGEVNDENPIHGIEEYSHRTGKWKTLFTCPRYQGTILLLSQ